MNTLLEEAIDSWTDTREGLIEEVENLPANRFDFRPAPESRSAEELVLHIMQVALMATGELTREDTNFHRHPWLRLLALYSKPIDGISGKRQLRSALRSTFRDSVKAFRRAGDIHMLQQIVRFDGNQGTRLQWLHHGISHEMYHRGQLALYARLLGKTPALTQRIHGS
ncbi:MAG TPA: DinB family protein [Thermoanaerobaculia bacterium]|nr:DinB family protein [Thermoanaerobaculia bacterium]